MSDNGSNISRRSSSQTSQVSSDGKKTKGGRGGPKRHSSKISTAPSQNEDPSLTSFPSFSPEQEVRQQGMEDERIPGLARTVSQKIRDRKATLAGLTNTSTGLNRQIPLFDDSPRTSLDIPGSLHLAGDDNIQRLIARTGALKLVRQYAQDLAQRDAEISALRVRADNRERELKRLLREADVSTIDIEKRLLRLEQPVQPLSDENVDSNESAPKFRPLLDGMMSEAMSDSLKAMPANNFEENVSGTLTKADDLVSDRQIKSSTITSRSTSRTNSTISHESQDLEATLRPRVSSTNNSRMPGLQGLFQTPSQSTSYFIGGNRTVKKTKAGDEISIQSTNSSKSFASWTQIFGGKNQANRPRASSLEPSESRPHQNSEAESALAKLSMPRASHNHTGVRSTSSLAPLEPAKSRSSGRRTPTAARFATTSTHIRKGSNASSLPPTVELDSMLEPSALPPTMTTQNTGSSGVLTDRFGFIYDHKQRRRQDKYVNQHRRNRPSGTETIGNFRSGRDTATESPVQVERPLSPTVIDEEAPKKSWQEYLKVPTNLSVSRPRELLSHTPSTSAVVTVSTADAIATITPPRTKDTSISVSATDQKAHPGDSSVTEPLSSTVNVTSTQSGREDDEESATDPGLSKMLLEQLNELHDSLQSERAVKWNDFLRRIRAEKTISTDRGMNNAPEAELLDGELIGIATLGRSNNSKGKYVHFKSLVLGGIPVSLRPKIWAECSGASSIRIPGYYEDIVARSQEVDDITASQIKADIRRTLTDNVFFRQGPGVPRLEELLRAYALHNQTIGYCQGLNLLGASLLLICATVEECFWLLVQIIDHILPSGYFTSGLLVSRADQQVFRSYVSEVLPRLDAKLKELGVELEACTFHWFMSLYAGVLTGGEALYRVWDVIIALNSSELMPNPFSEDGKLIVEMPTVTMSTPITHMADTHPEGTKQEDHDGTGSPFLFSLGLALLKLNESAILALESPAQVYTYVNHNMTNHAISIDALIQASEALRTRVKRSEVLERRATVVKTLSA